MRGRSAPVPAVPDRSAGAEHGDPVALPGVGQLRDPRHGSGRWRTGTGGERAADRERAGLRRPAGDGGQRSVPRGVHVRHRGQQRPGVRVRGGRRAARRPAGPRRPGRRTSPGPGRRPRPTTAMSWEISSSAAASSARTRADQLEHLALDRDVQRGGGLVGDQQRRGAHQPHADHRPLPHAAGELVRVLLGPPVRAGIRTARSRSTALRHRGAPAACPGAPAPPRPAAGRPSSPGSASSSDPGTPSPSRCRAAAAIAWPRRRRAGRRPGSPAGRRAPRPGDSISRAMASAVRLLPDPDSPTMPDRLAAARAAGDTRGPG